MWDWIAAQNMNLKAWIPTNITYLPSPQSATLPARVRGSSAPSFLLQEKMDELKLNKDKRKEPDWACSRTWACVRVSRRKTDHWMFAYNRKGTGRNRLTSARSRFSQSCVLLSSASFLTFIKCDENLLKDGILFKKWRLVWNFMVRTLCTSIYCQWGPHQRPSHLHGYPKVDCFSISSNIISLPLKTNGLHPSTTALWTTALIVTPVENIWRDCVAHVNSMNVLTVILVLI